MAKKKPSSDYWKKRFSDLEAAQNSYGQETFHQIEPSFEKAQAQIQSQIESWYQRYATNNGITMAEARKQLSAVELKELKWDVQEYIKYGQENAINQQWMTELENASARFHISRLEALKLRSQQALEVAFGNETDSLDSMMKHLYQSSYYHTCFEVQKGFNVGWEIGQVDEKKLQKVISRPWATDGKTFSDRVWNSKTQMVGDLHQQLTRTIIQGKSPDEAIRTMTKYLNDRTKNAKYQAGRLVMTEQAFISSAAQKDAFNELDVEEFEIVATLDSRTSEICQDMDGQHFPMKDYEPGVTAPPFHVYCRSTTVPYFNDEWSGGERAARGEDGKTYYVPSNMKYSEWQESLVDGDASDLQEIKEDDTIKVEEVINNNETVKGCVETLEKLGVQYNQVSLHQTPLVESEIIEVLSGGDKTKGSCASVGLSYVGQKNGLNVLDFRGGESQNFFSNGYNLKKIADLPNITKISEIARSSVTSGKKLLTHVQEGNEYYFVSGKHAAIVRKKEGILQYLELQSESRSGWNDFNGNVRYTLANRFGETKGYDCESYMFNVQDANDSKELQVLLGYINTVVDAQKKGVGGSVK